VGQAILPADALSSASEPAQKPARSQDWLPHKRVTTGEIANHANRAHG